METANTDKADTNVLAIISKGAIDLPAGLWLFFLAVWFLTLDIVAIIKKEGFNGQEKWSCSFI